MHRPYEKPPGLTPEHGAQFQDAAVVSAYRHREPYPEETFQKLRELAGTPSPRIADIGCGPGDLTLPMSRFARHIDAVDVSREMLAAAKRLGDYENINWIHGAAESAPLAGPYDLITAADSVHWMDWEALFALLKGQLRPGGFFCVVGRWYEEREWWDREFQSIIDAHSTNKEFKKYNIIEELEKSGYVKVEGSTKTQAMPFEQSVADLVEAFHSRNGFSRDRMGAGAALFDEAAKRHLEKFALNGRLRLHSVAHITWMTINE